MNQDVFRKRGLVESSGDVSAAITDLQQGTLVRHPLFKCLRRDNYNGFEAPTRIPNRDTGMDSWTCLQQLLEVVASRCYMPLYVVSMALPSSPMTGHQSLRRDGTICHECNVKLEHMNAWRPWPPDAMCYKHGFSDSLMAVLAGHSLRVLQATIMDCQALL